MKNSDIKVTSHEGDSSEIRELELAVYSDRKTEIAFSFDCRDGSIDEVYIDGVALEPEMEAYFDMHFPVNGEFVSVQTMISTAESAFTEICEELMQECKDDEDHIRSESFFNVY